MSVQPLPRDFTLRSKVMNLKLRRTWFDALVYIRDHGSKKWWAEFATKKGSAGSRRRMFRKLISCGYVTGSATDHVVTPHGQRYIKLCKDQFGWPDYRDEMTAVPIFVETGQ